jgi:AraC-like DNA-binding protein
VRGALIASLLLLAVGLARGAKGHAAARIGILLLLGLAIQTVASAPEVELGVAALWQAPLVAVSVGNGVLFWIFSKALFDDDFTVGRGDFVAWLAVAFASGLNCVLAPYALATLHRVLELIQRATPLACAVLVIVAASAHWASDLVEKRRSLRVLITAGGVIYSLVQLGFRLSTAQGRLSPELALADSTLLLVVVAGVAVRALVVENPELLGTSTKSAHASADAQGSLREGTSEVMPSSNDDGPSATPIEDATLLEDRLLAARLVARIRSERLYAKPDVDVANLAQTLAMPPYRLRRTINRGLGFRNFNAFINSFRLAEVKEALIDRRRLHLPILTLALEAGFQSIGPFNRSFKASTGLTPSEFREKYRAENEKELAEFVN